MDVTEKNYAHLLFRWQGHFSLEFINKVNKWTYLDVLTKLCVAVHKKHFEHYSKLVHHDDAPAHDVLTIYSFLTHYIFWYFQKINNAIKESRFSDISNTKKHVAGMLLKSILKEELQKYFEQWKHHLTSCIVDQGKCFEVDNTYQNLEM